MTFTRPMQWLAAGIAALALLGGCGGSGGGSSDPARVRVLNAVVDSEPLDVLVSDEVRASAVAAGATTQYVDVPEGQRIVKVRSTSAGNAILAQATANFFGEIRHTVVLRGQRSSIGILMLTDETSDPATGKFKLRLLSLSPETTLYDVYVVPSADISAATPTFAVVASGGAVDFTELDAGNRFVIFTIAGTKDVVFNSGQLTFAERERATLAIYPARAGRLVNAALLREGSGSVLANPLARLRFVNGLPGTTLDLKAGGTVLHPAVPYSQTSAYAETASGARALQVEATNVPGTALATLAATLEGARDHSLVAWGGTSQPRLLLLADDNTAAPAGLSRLRVVNALGDNVPVNVLVNFVNRAAALAAGTASPYLSVTAAEQNVTFTTPDGTAVIATVAIGGLASGSVQTIYLLGTSAAPSARLVTDR